MTKLCRKCHLPFKENHEVQGMFKAFWHELGSKIHFSISKPHEYVAETLEHVDCDNPEVAE